MYLVCPAKIPFAQFLEQKIVPAHCVIIQNGADLVQTPTNPPKIEILHACKSTAGIPCMFTTRNRRLGLRSPNIERKYYTILYLVMVCKLVLFY